MPARRLSPSRNPACSLPRVGLTRAEHTLAFGDCVALARTIRRLIGAWIVHTRPLTYTGRLGRYEGPQGSVHWLAITPGWPRTLQRALTRLGLLATCPRAMPLAPRREPTSPTGTADRPSTGRPHLAADPAAVAAAACHPAAGRAGRCSRCQSCRSPCWPTACMAYRRAGARLGRPAAARRPGRVAACPVAPSARLAAPASTPARATTCTPCGLERERQSACERVPARGRSRAFAPRRV